MSQTLKPGYKQTEVGVIPEEWDVPYLRRHLLQDATYGVVKAGAFQRSGIPMLRSGEIKNASIIEDHPLIRPEKSQEYSRTILKKNDVVIALVGYPGETAVIPDRLIGANISRAVGLLRPASNLTPEFLTCYLNSPNGRKEFLRPSAGSAQIVVNLGALNKLRLPIPSLPEQRAIAEALSDVDALLAALDRLIAKQRDLKQAAMQQLLTGQTRLPGFTGKWETKRLGEVASVKTGPFGSSLHESDYVTVGTPIITVEHLGEFGVEHTNLPLVSDFDRQRLKAYSLELGDIVFSRVGSVDRNALIRPSEEGWLFSGRLLRVRPDKRKAHAPFLSFQFHGEVFIAAVLTVAVGQTMACLNTQILKGIYVCLPPLPEQTAIATVLSDMDLELAALEQRRDKTRALKQGMMQELLTGRTRLV